MRKSKSRSDSYDSKLPMEKPSNDRSVANKMLQCDILRPKCGKTIMSNKMQRNASRDDSNVGKLRPHLRRSAQGVMTRDRNSVEHLFAVRQIKTQMS